MNSGTLAGAGEKAQIAPRTVLPMRRIAADAAIVSLVDDIIIVAPFTIFAQEAAMADPAGAVAVTVAVATNPGGGGILT